MIHVQNVQQQRPDETPTVRPPPPSVELRCVRFRLPCAHAEIVLWSCADSRREP